MESCKAQSKVEGVIIHHHQLINEALHARTQAYTPYSKFNVGAALIDSQGTIYSAANIENASYGLSICAEQSAIVSAASKGMRQILAICVVGNTQEPISPCGACRQFIKEFAHPDIVIILSNTQYKKKLITLEELLPYAFGPEDL